MKLSGVDKCISTYNTYISEFWFRWHEVRPIARRHHYKAVENVHMSFFPEARVGTCYLSQDILTSGHSRWLVCSFDPMTSPLGHLRSYEVKWVFYPHFWQNRDRAPLIVLKCLPNRVTTIDKRHDLLGSPCDLKWPCLRIILTLTF